MDTGPSSIRLFVADPLQRPSHLIRIQRPSCIQRSTVINETRSVRGENRINRNERRTTQSHSQNAASGFERESQRQFDRLGFAMDRIADRMKPDLQQIRSVADYRDGVQAMGGSPHFLRWILAMKLP
jgi:hypothetical protein